jgi:hypothetical protein
MGHWAHEAVHMSDEHATAIDADVLAQARAAAAEHPVLADALARLDALDDADLDSHPAEFDAIHRALREALADAGPGATDVP